MACWDLERRRPRWRAGRKGLFSNRMFSCSCLCGEKEPSQEEKTSKGLDWDERGSGENTVRVTVEDLGIVNGGFSLADEDPVTQKSGEAHSSSSETTQKQLEAPSSPAVQPQVQLTTIHSIGEEEEDIQLLFDEDTDNTPGSGVLLMTPEINLILPTPSNVTDGNQFFCSNSEESMTHACSEGSSAAGDEEEKIINTNEEESSAGCVLVDVLPPGAEREPEHKDGPSEEPREQKEAEPLKKWDKYKFRPKLSCSSHQVAPVRFAKKKRRFSSGISLLPFTEHNLDDPGRSTSCSEMLKAELHLLPDAAAMNSSTHQKTLLRSCSLGDTTAQPTAPVPSQPAEQSTERKKISRQRRLTVASYIPQSMDQNRNVSEKDVNRQEAKSLCELNTEGVCQWFTRIGLQKCLPFIREAKLCGGDIASVDANLLDTLRVVTVEDRERLLSAIYNELHPPSTVTQTLDSLLESSSAETCTSYSASLTQSRSSPHVSCLSKNRRSFKLRNGSQNQVTSRSSHVIEITVNASERIVHLRTPKETTVGKLMDLCIKMLGVTDDQSFFIMKEKQDSADELCPDQQIGTLLTSENKQLELYMCKTEKQNSPKLSCEKSNVDLKVQENQAAKEDRIRELNQQVDSLQNIVLQIQELHHGLVAFCSELKNTDADVNVDGLDSAELKQKLEAVNGQLKEKRQKLQTLRDNVNSTAHKDKQLEVRLLEKMSKNCQVFKEEITTVHLNRQAAHLQKTLQERCVKEKAEKQTLAAGSLSQLVSPESPAMLMVVQENQNPDGRFGFTCRCRERGGLVVVQAVSSHLRVDDRLVEVNGVPVVNASVEQLNDVLLHAPCAQIVVLRRLPPGPDPSLRPQPRPSSGPAQTPWYRRDAVATETLPQRKVMAI